MAQIKNPKRIQDRRKAVEKYINGSNKNITDAVSTIAKRLYLSERTVWRDLAYQNNNTY